MSNLPKLLRSDPRFCADYLSKLSPGAKERIFKDIPAKELKRLMGDWTFWARDDQLPPAQWGEHGTFIWNVRAGRGWGKTRASAEAFIWAVKAGGYKYPNMAGATAEDVRSIMIEGESGILACAPDNFRPEYIPSLKKLIWPNGVTSNIFYGSEPDKSRGAQSDFLWLDEVAKWNHPEETFDNLLMGLRLGPNPLCVVTSTPLSLIHISEPTRPY